MNKKLVFHSELSIEIGKPIFEIEQKLIELKYLEADTKLPSKKALRTKKAYTETQDKIYILMWDIKILDELKKIFFPQQEDVNFYNLKRYFTCLEKMNLNMQERIKNGGSLLVDEIKYRDFLDSFYSCILKSKEQTISFFFYNVIEENKSDTMLEILFDLDNFKKEKFLQIKNSYEESKILKAMFCQTSEKEQKIL